jgi:hypothetical protein
MTSNPTIEDVSAATYISWAAARLNVTDPSVNRARGGDNSTVFEIESGAEDCPFEAYIPGETLVHGDACLPNIIIGGDGPGGYIGLGRRRPLRLRARAERAPTGPGASSDLEAKPGSVRYQDDFEFDVSRAGRRR